MIRHHSSDPRRSNITGDAQDKLEFDIKHHDKEEQEEEEDHYRMGGIKDVQTPKQANFGEMNDLYGQGNMIKKKIVKEQSENERLTEQLTKRKM